jgi:hypothetical protein
MERLRSTANPDSTAATRLMYDALTCKILSVLSIKWLDGSDSLSGFHMLLIPIRVMCRTEYVNDVPRHESSAVGSFTGARYSSSGIAWSFSFHQTVVKAYMHHHRQGDVRLLPCLESLVVIRGHIKEIARVKK